MAEQDDKYSKVLKVFRLETTAEISVSYLGMQVQSVHADLIPLDSEDELRAAFTTAGLIPVQVGYALRQLRGAAKDQGFIVPIEQSVDLA